MDPFFPLQLLVGTVVLTGQADLAQPLPSLLLRRFEILRDHNCCRQLGSRNNTKARGVVGFATDPVHKLTHVAVDTRVVLDVAFVTP